MNENNSWVYYRNKCTCSKGTTLKLSKSTCKDKSNWIWSIEITIEINFINVKHFILRYVFLIAFKKVNVTFDHDSFQCLFPSWKTYKMSMTSYGLTWCTSATVWAWCARGLCLFLLSVRPHVAKASCAPPANVCAVCLGLQRHWNLISLHNN